MIPQFRVCLYVKHLKVEFKTLIGVRLDSIEGFKGLFISTRWSGAQSSGHQEEVCGDNG